MPECAQRATFPVSQTRSPISAAVSELSGWRITTAAGLNIQPYAGNRGAGRPYGDRVDNPGTIA